MTVRYRSGDFTVATAVGILRNESPLLPELNEVLIFHQDYVQLLNSFTALPYNDPNPDLLGETAYLINESPREDFGGNKVKWTRSWARVPSSYSMSGGIYVYNFPGFATGRAFEVSRFPVAVRIQRDFFLCGNLGTFTQWEDIPITKAFAPYEGGDSTDYVNELSDTTTPTLNDYLAAIFLEQEIQIEDSKVRSWMGSIYVRENFFVKAR